MTDEITVWTPTEFEGTDLLPVPVQRSESDLPIVGEENIDAEEMRVPVLKLLQGMSPECTEGEIEDAKPGLLYHTGSQQVIKPPIRTLVLHHGKSNAMYPDPKKDPRYEGLEECVSRDGVEGSVYGDCRSCGRTGWVDKMKPLCTKAHDFVLMLPDGPAKIRFKVFAYQSATNFTMAKKLQRKNFWDHPLVIWVKRRVNKLENGKDATSYYFQCRWDTSIETPGYLRQQAYELHQTLAAAYGEGKMADDEPEFDDTVRF